MAALQNLHKYKPFTASSDWSRLGNTLCLLLPILPARDVLESRSTALDFALNAVN